MHKKAFLACMLVVTMLLTGCTLIEKDEAVDRATEVVRVSNSAGGEDIVYTKGEVLDEVNYQLNYMSYLYSRLGYSYDPTDPTIIAQTKGRRDGHAGGGRRGNPEGAGAGPE